VLTSIIGVPFFLYLIVRERRTLGGASHDRGAFLAARSLQVTLAGRAVLRDVVASAVARHLVALVGPNGAGKTTLLRALAGLLPSQGAVDVGGRCARVVVVARTGAALCLSPQGTSCTGRCRRDIVALGRYPHAPPTRRLAPKDQEAWRGRCAPTDVTALAERPVTELSGASAAGGTGASAGGGSAGAAGG